MSTCTYVNEPALKKAKSAQCNDPSCYIWTQLPGCVEDLNSSEEMFLDFLGGFDNRSRQLEIYIEPTENSKRGIIHETFHLSGDNDTAQLHAFLHVLEQAKMARWQDFQIDSEFPLSLWTLIMNDGDKIQCKDLRLMNDDSAGMYENVNYLGFAQEFMTINKIQFDSRSIMEKDSFEKVFEFLMNAADCCDEIVLDFSLIDDTVECLANAAQAFLACNNPAHFVSQATFIICAPEVNINDWASTDLATAHLAAHQNNRYIYEFVHVQTGVMLQMSIKCDERDNNIEKIAFIKND